MIPRHTYWIRILFCCSWLFLMVFDHASAQNHPRYQMLRQEENWDQRKELLDPSFPDKIKFIPLTKNGQGFISLGGELRSYLKFYHNQQLGAMGRDGYLLQRAMAHATLTTQTTDENMKMSAFLQLKSGLVGGRNGPVSPVNKDKLDINQAFFEIQFSPDENRTILLRSGCQELRYGVGRMIEVREGPNVRFGFDALLGRYETQKWRIDAFGAIPTDTSPGIFDNDRIPNHSLWGMYGSGPGIDLYYLGFERPFLLDSKIRHTKRHTFGARWHGSSTKFSYDAEIALQLGRFEEQSSNSTSHEGSIRAWNLNVNTTYTFSKTSQIGLDLLISSGDNSTTDHRVETFRAPYPSGKYTSTGSIIGPFNLIKIQPFLKFSPLEKLHIIPSSYFFWRNQTSDHLYAMSGALYRQDTSNKKYIGTQPEMLIIWKANRHITAFLETAYFFEGSFIQHFENSNDMLYLGLRVGYKF